jgi:hypothetical protein
MEVVLFMALVLPSLGKFLPSDSEYKNPNYALYNKQPHHMFAPVTFIVGVFFMLYYTWMRYDIISHSYQSLFSCVLGLSVLIGQCIDGCHELLHRNEKVFNLISFLGLIPFQFTTYPIEHLYLHHKHVGTPDDAISSPKNQSFFKYFFKAIYSSYV